ncbi:MAG: tRNA pseudouridine(55) synthase TruB [Oscillospiraceae bacterium]|nr:tRNA pseudouridine(55) synthase TruB [Oscillospiraceae bacterium]
MNGIILVDKPEGWTSMDVCAKLRGVLHTKRIGHSGTLDPMATGLLVIFAGRATRGVQFAENDEKEYIATLRLGITTDTQDTTGNILEEKPVNVSDSEIAAALDKFKGEIDQIPPMYSAIKINGQKLYDIARRGGEVERKARRVTIFELELLSREGNDVFLRVRCSKGTYIRALCNDIGEQLGCGGCMASLRRTFAGRYSLENAYTMQQLTSPENDLESIMLPLESLFADRDRVVLSPKQEKVIRNGGEFSCDMHEGEYTAYSEIGEFLALCNVENGKMRVIKSFYEV